MPHYKDVEKRKYNRKTHNGSFKYALNGIAIAYKTQPNFRFHCVFFVLVTLASIIYQITLVEYALILVVSSLVFCMELINTVVEAVGDEISGGEHRHMVGIAKDVAAGGVLISVAFAVGVGLVIFLPRAWEIVKFYF